MRSHDDHLRMHAAILALKSAAVISHNLVTGHNDEEL